MITRGLWGRIWGYSTKGPRKLIALARVEEYGVPVGGMDGYRTTDLMVFWSPPEL